MMKKNEKTYQMEFNFECILETCELQDETLKKAQQELKVDKDNYDKEYSENKQLKAQLEQKKQNLLEIKLDIDKNLLKVDNITSKIVAINEETATLQKEISVLNEEIVNQSNDSTKRMLDIDEGLKQLNKQFEVEILEGLIKEVAEKLLLSLRFENKYEEDFEMLNNCNDVFDPYHRLTSLNDIIGETSEEIERNVKLEDLQKIEKNIAFLQNEYAKQLKLFQNYAE